MSKKVIGTKYGIEITKPWNSEMYDHNDKVAELLKIELENTLKSIYNDGNCSKEKLNEFAGAIGSKYGFGFDLKGMYDGITDDLEYLQNYQIADELDYYVKKGFIQQPKIGFVGYDK